MSPSRCVAAVLSLVALTGTDAAAQSPRRLPKADTSVQKALDSGATSLRVIVRTSPDCRTTVRQSLVSHGDTIVGDQAPIDAFTAIIHASDAENLDANTCVKAVSDDAIVAGHAAPSGGGSGTATINVLRETLGLASTTLTGAGVGIAVIDSGITSKIDFEGRIVGALNFLNGASGVVMATDDYGHGTHVAGLMGSTGAQSSGSQYKGVAPGAALISLAVLDKNGQGRTSDVINAINWAIAHKQGMKIDIINLSLGHPIYEPAASDPLVLAVEQAVRAGIVVVASAGNYGVNQQTGQSGYAGVTSPGNAPSAITVGAFNTNGTVARDDDRVTPYSSKGPTWYDGFAKPDIVAPGHKLVSDTARTTTLYKNYTALRVGSDYMTLSGSSMAAAVTSGVAALVIQANRVASQNAYPAHPSLTPNALKAILQFSAFRMKDAQGIEYDYLTQGAGSLNAAGAVDLASAIDTSVAVGGFWRTTGVTFSTTIAGVTLPWAQSVVWGDSIVWGDTLATNQPAWAQSIVWGDSVVWGDSIVWGASIVWGDSVVWGDSIVWGDNLLNRTNPSQIVWGDIYSTGTVLSNTDVWATVTF